MTDGENSNKTTQIECNSHHYVSGRDSLVVSVLD